MSIVRRLRFKLVRGPCNSFEIARMNPRHAEGVAGGDPTPTGKGWGYAENRAGRTCRDRDAARSRWGRVTEKMAGRATERVAGVPKFDGLGQHGGIYWWTHLSK